MLRSIIGTSLSLKFDALTKLPPAVLYRMAFCVCMLPLRIDAGAEGSGAAGRASAPPRPAFFAGRSEVEHRRLESFRLLLHVLTARLASRAQRLADVGQVAEG